MKFKLDNNKRGLIAIGGLSALTLLTLIMLLFCRINNFTGIGNFNPFGFEDSGTIPVLGAACLVMLFLCLIATGGAIINYFLFKKEPFKWLKIAAVINIVSGAVFFVICALCFVAGENGNLGSFAYLIFETLFYLVVHLILIPPEINLKQQPPISGVQIKNNIYNAGQSILSISIVWACVIALAINTFVLQFMPLYIYEFGKTESIISIFNALHASYLYERIIALIFLPLLYANFVFLVIVAIKFVTNTVKFLKAAKYFAIYNIFIACCVMVYSISKVFIARYFNIDTKIVTQVNVIIAFLIFIVFTVFAGQAERQNQLKHNRAVTKIKRQSILPLLFLFIATAATFSTLYFKLYSLNVNAPTGTPVHQEATGYQLIINSQGTFQSVLAVVLLAFCIISAMLFVVNILNYIVNAENYKQSALNSTYLNVIFQLLFFLTGLVFVVMVPSFNVLLQAIFGEIILSFLGEGFNISEYVISETMSHIPLIIGFSTVILMQLVCFAFKSKPASKKSTAGGRQSTEFSAGSVVSAAPLTTEKANSFGDPCPAFSEIDNNVPYYTMQLRERIEERFEDLTLEKLTDFIVEFARNTPERLSYSKESIATFIAGMGASRLSILQGLSGTGKTSLPKVFMKAINGNCDIVEIESSWRDKNELLGYYNEFSRKYTPKKFTQYLYKARLNNTVPTFIVLDEMNLSRIEYYFSDFLSLMETDGDKRVIKLLNIQIFPDNENGDGAGEYLGLNDGHSMAIPSNVWFVGTANRDESTFEISDKVYDRAITMNFDKRAPKIMASVADIPPRYVDYNQLEQLFEEAKTIEFNAETNPLVIEIEKILAPYEISFGNRSLKQIEDFVKIYLKCNDISTTDKYNYALNTAVETALLTKAVRKLELKIIENKAQLISEFESINCKRCAAFINGLVEN